MICKLPVNDEAGGGVSFFSRAAADDRRNVVLFAGQPGQRTGAEVGRFRPVVAEGAHRVRSSQNQPAAAVFKTEIAAFTVAAIGVAAHECGHAVQHQVGYVPIKIRNGIVPIVNVCNTLSMPIFIIGLILGLGRLAMVGAILFGAVLVFQLVTLPTEINASRRAMKTLESMYLLEGDELTGARKTLTAAAMTYVAAVASTALQFLRLVLLANRRRD